MLSYIILYLIIYYLLLLLAIIIIIFFCVLDDVNDRWVWGQPAADNSTQQKEDRLRQKSYQRNIGAYDCANRLPPYHSKVVDVVLDQRASRIHFRLKSGLHTPI